MSFIITLVLQRLWSGLFLRWVIDQTPSKETWLAISEMKEKEKELKRQAIKLRKQLIELEKNVNISKTRNPNASMDGGAGDNNFSGTEADGPRTSI